MIPTTAKRDLDRDVGRFTALGIAVYVLKSSPNVIITMFDGRLRLIVESRYDRGMIVIICENFHPGSCCESELSHTHIYMCNIVIAMFGIVIFMVL